MSGSGTLVAIDGVRGILTGRHVVEKWRNSKPKDQRPKRLGIIPGKRASSLVEEPLEHFDSTVLGPGQSNELGPDLAFVRIPSPSDFLSELLAKKSFCDLTGPTVKNHLIVVTRSSPIAACGVVAEKTAKSGNRTTVNQYVIFGTEPQVFERDEYDYIDLRSRRSLEPKTPSSFGGVSGSGLWRFSIARIAEGQVKPYDFQVAGVAFYQLPDSDDGVATIRFHGPISIYEKLLPKVRDWVRGE